MKIGFLVAHNLVENSCPGILLGIVVITIAFVLIVGNSKEKNLLKHCPALDTRAQTSYLSFFSTNVLLG